MLYLAGQFFWFLLAAAVLGLVMGWISQSGRDPRFWGSAWTAFAVLWAIAAAMAWFQFVNGMLATWVETALLFTAVYWLGCVAGGLLGSAVSSRQPPILALATANPPAATRVEPILSAPPPTVANTEAVGQHPGQRPAGLTTARNGEADDLKRIKGIGRQNEERLHGLGIWHFDQIAAWTPQNIEWVGSYLAFPGRIEREDWVGQAMKQAKPATRDASDGPEGSAGKAEIGPDAEDASPAGQSAADEPAEAPDPKKA